MLYVLPSAGQHQPETWHTVEIEIFLRLCENFKLHQTFIDLQTKLSKEQKYFIHLKCLLTKHFNSSAIVYFLKIILIT